MEIRIIIKCLILVILITPVFSNVQSAEFTVNKTIDGADINPGDGVCDAGGGCTLRAAVMETNALAGADTIILPDGLYILALGNTGEDAAVEGDLDILDDLTITGADPTTTTVNGNSYLYRVFSILKRTDNTLPVVEISNITMSQGLDSDLGALVYNNGNLMLNNVILTDANPNNYALFNGGNLKVTNSKVVNNSAGIRSQNGAVDIMGTVFAGNNGGNNAGGTVVLSSSSARISNSSFSNNISYDLGGAIYQVGGELVIDSSSFTGNTVTGSYNTFSANGGAIASRGGALEISSSSFNNNNVSALGLSTEAGSGGAIIIAGTDYVDIDNSTFTNNSSSGVGGAIYVYENGTGIVHIRRITVDGNSSESYGGGIFVGGGVLGLLAEKVVISESRIINNTASVGGGVAFSSSLFSSQNLEYQFIHSEISGNTADIAGGVFANGRGNAFQNLTIFDNFAITHGGGFVQ
ncbi:MAG TPA: hypothetical protein ENJ35_09125, partial [Gammaproteobacteria bacterium]|nr:hypothetical protein [Gammaproteobacteria bacterium]